MTPDTSKIDSVSDETVIVAQFISKENERIHDY